MKTPLKTMTGSLSLLCCLFMPAFAQVHSDTTVATKSELRLQGTPTIELNAKFVSAGPPVAAPRVGPGAGYGSIRYAVGEGYDRNDIRAILRYVAYALPAQFGNTSGSYTITITIKDLSGKILVKEPVLSFQWTKERGFLFIEKTVNEVQKTSWSGTLVNQMPVKQSNQRLRMEIEIFYHEDRSLDFDLLKTTAKMFSTGALATFLPLPAAALPIIDSVAEFVNSFYAGAKKQTLVEQEELILGRPGSKTAPIVFKGENGGQVVVPITISVETIQTRLAEGLTNGKFDPNALSQAIFSTTEISLGDKAVPVIELLSTSDNKQFRSARSLLDALLEGGTYGKDPSSKKEQDVGSRCSALYDALNTYLSTYDARAMFWAFLRKYGDSMDRAACLGTRQSELVAVGLAP